MLHTFTGVAIRWCLTDIFLLFYGIDYCWSKSYRPGGPPVSKVNVEPCMLKTYDKTSLKMFTCKLHLILKIFVCDSWLVALIFFKEFLFKHLWNNSTRRLQLHVFNLPCKKEWSLLLGRSLDQGQGHCRPNWWVGGRTLEFHEYILFVLCTETTSRNFHVYSNFF